jgi:uncharacterized membrane protein YdjX (TVP38/TMEM64 family)
LETHLKHLKRYWPLLIIAALLALLIGSGGLQVLSVESIQAHHAELSAYVAEHQLLAGLVQVAVSTLLMATALPGTSLVNLAAGFLFGVWVATFQGVLGTVLGSYMLFWAVQHAIGESLVEQGKALGERLRAAFEKNPVSYALFLRLVPAFPFGMITLALAFLRCSPRLFLGASLIGSVPSTFAVCWLGSGLGAQLRGPDPIDASILRQPGILLPLAALALLALVPVLVERFRRSR